MMGSTLIHTLKKVKQFQFHLSFSSKYILYTLSNEDTSGKSCRFKKIFLTIAVFKYEQSMQDLTENKL